MSKDLTDEIIEKIAEDYAKSEVPKPSHSLSISRYDLKAGFIAGMKRYREILEKDGHDIQGT